MSALPPPACPNDPSPANNGTWDASALCVGGPHVTKFSAAKPPTLRAGTTLQAVACGMGGNSDVVKHVMRVTAPPGTPVLEFLTLTKGKKQRQAPTMMSSEGLWVPT